MYSRATIAQILQRIRISKNLSQAEFAYPIYTQSLLSRIEMGTTHPTFARFVALMDIHQIRLPEVDFLLAGSEAKHLIIDKAIKELDIPIILNALDAFDAYNENQKAYFIFWMNYCFGVSFQQKNNLSLTTITQTLDQDELFNSDIIQIAYCLPLVPKDSMQYTYNRIVQQVASHEIAISYPEIEIVAAISIASYYRKDNNLEQVRFYLTHALNLSVQKHSVHFYIICSLLLYANFHKKLHLQQAQTMNTLFSTDNYFNYWYNTITQLKNK